MTSRIRRAICEQLPQLKTIYHALEIPPKSQQTTISRPSLQWVLPADVAQREPEFLESVKSQRFDTTYIESVRVVPATGRNAAKVEFQLQPEAFTAHLLQADSAPATSDFHESHVVVEYSSPNIAKPFHVGHLRSTIIGNVLANLYQHLGYRTTRLNYLGDWGTQFGLLALGVQLSNVNEADMREAPIETLYNAYVVANKAASVDSQLTQQARDLFSALESGSDRSMSAKWHQYRQYTIEELQRVYDRLGVHFDSYEWESRYSQREITDVLTQLRSAGILQREEDGRETVVMDQRRVPVIKSDGSTLYLARDIAALVERQKRLQFSRMLYVVDNGQTDHFKALFQTAALLDNCLSDKLQHVKFGRIHGMSTRQGKAVFLRDVLNEARDVMRERRNVSATTKVNSSLNDDLVCDILGVSAVLVNVLKQRRQRDYEFNWQQALQVNGDTGIKLQYTHCRLHSLLDNFRHVDLGKVTPSWQHFNQEPADALDVLYELARFEQCVWQAKEQLETCVLVNYLFSLCNATSRALKRLPVKQEKCLERQKQRLLLFHAAKRTLQAGMKLLSLKPLNQM